MFVKADYAKSLDKEAEAVMQYEKPDLRIIRAVKSMFVKKITQLQLKTSSIIIPRT